LFWSEAKKIAKSVDIHGTRLEDKKPVELLGSLKIGKEKSAIAL